MKRNFIFSLRTVLIISIFTLFILHISIFAQGNAAEIDKLMQLYHDYGQFNGSVLVAKGGKVIFKKGYGHANIEWNIPNQPDTKHRIGSVTKQFTSMLTMQLVEEGKLDLDGKITDYLSGYRKDIGDRVTVHQLLTHTSGIPSYTNLPGFESDISRNPYSVDAFVDKYCSGNLEFEPGSRFSYSNSGYFLLGAIIGKVTGKTFEEVLQEKILEPLNMENTGYDHHETIITNRAAGYDNTLEGLKNAPYLDMSPPYAAGAMYSTVGDLYLWDQALYTRKLLSKKNKEIMFKPYMKNYAYGWDVRTIDLPESRDSLRVISHGGGINGFNALIWRLVDDRHLVVLLNNTGRTVLSNISTAITNILYGVPNNLPKKPLAKTLYKTYVKNGAEAVIKQYHELKKKNPDDYNFGESELNRLGSYLLSTGQIDDAIEIFKLNMDAYPDKFIVYYSLGEAYLRKGHKELAIKNFAKSLELNPRFTRAIDMLQRINKKNK